jgi:hypothetical protein
MYDRQVCNMRQSKRMGKMKEERVRKLEELGFLWRCEQTGKVIWEEMIEKLKAFQARHGHCRFAPLRLLFVFCPKFC